MSEVTCPDPHFTFDEEHGWWRHCDRCGRPAWEHEQSDPLQDVRNYAGMYSTGKHPRDFPPAMKAT